MVFVFLFGISCIVRFSQGVVVTTNAPINLGSQVITSTIEPQTTSEPVDETQLKYINFFKQHMPRALLAASMDCVVPDQRTPAVLSLNESNACTVSSYKMQLALGKVCASTTSSCFTNECKNFFNPQNPLIKEAMQACTDNPEFFSRFARIMYCARVADKTVAPYEINKESLLIMLKNFVGQSVQGLRTSLMYTHKHCKVPTPLDESLQPNHMMLEQYRQLLARDYQEYCDANEEAAEGDKTRREDKVLASNAPPAHPAATAQIQAPPRRYNEDQSEQLWELAEGNAVQFNLDLFSCELCELANVSDTNSCCDCLNGNKVLASKDCEAYALPLNEILVDMDIEDLEKLLPQNESTYIQKTFMGVQGFSFPDQIHYCDMLRDYSGDIESLFNAPSMDSSSTMNPGVTTIQISTDKGDGDGDGDEEGSGASIGGLSLSLSFTIFFTLLL
eukprot:m.35199 g.35199  ORF g.35199 m.35199 type:complete len:447 (-) comp8855_c0_seq1:768-2108(-)